MLDRFILNVKNSKRNIRITHVYYPGEYVIDGNNVEVIYLSQGHIHVHDGFREECLRATKKDFEELKSAASQTTNFVECGNSCIVNLSKIESYSGGMKNQDVILYTKNDWYVVDRKKDDRIDEFLEILQNKNNIEHLL